ncbi:aquaporin-like protein [Syncephalis fuscata]|nr:aquaporin-like protein [Syncephalis fuscata]
MPENSASPSLQHAIDLESIMINEKPQTTVPLKRVASKPFVAFISRKGTLLYRFRQFQYAYRDYLAEFLATLVFLILGLGVNAQYTVGVSSPDSFFAGIFTWGLAVTCGVYVGGSVSGAHLNPAVTLGLYLFRGFPRRKVLGYMLTQIIAAFLAAAVVYACFQSEWNMYDGGVRQLGGDKGTAGIFYVRPKEGVTLGNHFLSELVGTLVCCCPNAGPVMPIIFGFMVTAILLALGYTTGHAINPCRDFGPRLFAATIYGAGVFSYDNYYFWVPIVGPLIGGPLGCLLYDLFVASTPLGEEYTMEPVEYSELSEVRAQ